MAKDDYFKIVFLILEYLYECLKAGKDFINIEHVKINSIIDDIPLGYFNNIVLDICDEGYAKSITEEIRYVHQNKSEVIALKITMKGVEYFSNNTEMKRIAKFLKELKSITPGL